MHFRTAGAGPPVVLVHQSPQHSGAWQNLMRRLADRFTLIAPDTPGFGYSDLLANPNPAITDLAAATLELCDVLELGQFAVIGTHTGAAIAAELGIQAPDRVVHLFLDGYPLFTADESKQILSGYFPDNPPRWDGGHLIWAWQRLREQLLFFPWFDHRLETRMDWPIPAPEGLQSQLLELLLAGEQYKVGYRAAFEDDASIRPAAQKVPVAYLYRTTDILAPHAPRLRNLPENARIDMVEGAVPDMEAHIDSCLSALPPWPSATLSSIGRQLKESDRFVDGETASLAVTRLGNPQAPRKIVVIHDLGQSADCMAHWLNVSHDEIDLCLVDLPGHGMSNEFEAEDYRFETLCRNILQAIESLDINKFELVAKGAAAALSTYLVAQAGARHIRVDRVLLLEPLLLEDGELTAFKAASTMPRIEASGSHLLTTWMRVRDSRLVWPWFSASGDRICGEGMDPEVLQAEWLALWLTQPNHSAIMAATYDADLTQCDYAALPADTTIQCSPAPTLAVRQRKLARTHHYECFSDEMPTESRLRHWLR